jgi:NAD-dependent SIR2 family protein deacetylase
MERSTDADPLDARIRQAAELVLAADALLVGAGAGMGVDSGLPDFRGDAGFWKAYPPFQGRSFASISTPRWFHADPALAWGFFGHRLGLYRATRPHAGFEILRRWGEGRPLGAFVFTSNVDGQFQRAGFDESRVFECHGSIHHLQCARDCGAQVWPADDVTVDVDEATMRARSEPPTCPRCGGIARPNILMFGDASWLPTRLEVQGRAYVDWLRRAAGRRIVAVELGAGLAIPTVRMECEQRARALVRINPRDPATRGSGISIPLGALDALRRIDAHVRELAP